VVLTCGSSSHVHFGEKTAQKVIKMIKYVSGMMLAPVEYLWMKKKISSGKLSFCQRRFERTLPIAEKTKNKKQPLFAPQEKNCFSAYKRQWHGLIMHFFSRIWPLRCPPEHFVETVPRAANIWRFMGFWQPQRLFGAEIVCFR
jgi:hypothetical protein